MANKQKKTTIWKINSMRFDVCVRVYDTLLSEHFKNDSFCLTNIAVHSFKSLQFKRMNSIMALSLTLSSSISSNAE